jgi:ATP-dependent Lon protease
MAELPPIDFDKRRIPLFPLPAVVFPGEPLPLHIFEPRFKELVGYCLADPTETRLFAIAMTENRQLRPIGCGVRIERVVRRYDNGELDIVVVGERRYEMKQLLREQSYPEVEVEFFDDLSLPGHPLQLEQAVTMHARLIELVKGKTPSMYYPEGAANSFILAHEAGFDLAQRQRLLEMRREEHRLDYLIAYYKEVIPVLAEKEEIQERVRANGYFRRFPGEPLE